MEFKEFKKEDKELKSVSLKSILSGSMLTSGLILKNIWLVVWLTFLCIVYIGNRYHAERVARHIDALQKEVKDLRAESITTAAQLMNLRRQSKVMEMVKAKQLDLEEAIKPPYKISE
ncbi:MAG: hypothetical protein LBV39_06445 [Bacteroidales bacterium]|jgi:cell division protein FtsB|nr:hypothetical protein [Bacteroidales bacterium]